MATSLARGDKYVDYLVKKIKASPVWIQPQKKVAIVLMFDEGNATAPDINSCCGWKAGKTVTNAPLIQNADGTFSPDTSVNNYKAGNQGHGKSIFGILTNQAERSEGHRGQRRLTATFPSCARYKTCSCSPIRPRTART